MDQRSFEGVSFETPLRPKEIRMSFLSNSGVSKGVSNEFPLKLRWIQNSFKGVSFETTFGVKVVSKELHLKHNWIQRFKGVSFETTVDSK